MLYNDSSKRSDSGKWAIVIFLFSFFEKHCVLRMKDMFLQLLLALLFGALCADQAKKRGRHPVVWFCLGALFNLFAVAALFILPSLFQDGLTVEEEHKGNGASASDATSVSELPLVGDPRCRQWFFLDGTSVAQGPVAFRNIHNAWDKKLLSAESYVWTEGMSEWKPIRAMPALFERLQLFS